MTDNSNDQRRENKERLRFRLAAQLAAMGEGLVGNAPRAIRARVARDPVRVKYILAVDDEPSVLELIAASLHPEHFGVLTCSSVEEARGVIQSRSDISLILTDLRMPGEDGFALLDFLRCNLRFRHIPVVVMSSCSDVRYVQLAAELGASAYLVKPFTSEALVERVSGVLQASAIVILLVSDDAICRTILSRDITSAGYSVQTAENGQLGLELLKAGNVNIVICEMVLDDMTGLDLMAQASECSSCVPFLFVSDPQLKVSDEIVKAVGGYGLIRRPFRNSEVIKNIRAVEPRPHYRATDSVK